jgi:hypothetical protein
VLKCRPIATAAPGAFSLFTFEMSMARKDLRLMVEEVRDLRVSRGPRR